MDSCIGGRRLRRAAAIAALAALVLAVSSEVLGPAAVLAAVDDGERGVRSAWIDGDVPGVFEDNGSGVHRASIDGLAQLGTFEGTGCGDGLFCPGEPVLRWEMAVWLARILVQLEAAEEPPEPSEPRFEDVGVDEWWAPHVELLAGLEVTIGCATEPALFCPDDAVSRAQMALFLARAFELAPPTDGGSQFADIDGNVHADDIVALAASGITKGCAVDPARFCPDQLTTRAEMASFLFRAYTRAGGPCPSEDTEDTADTADTAGGGGGGGSPGPSRPRQEAQTPPLGEPQSVSVHPGDETLTVTWGPPAEVGAEVLIYRVQWKGPGQDYSDTERWDLVDDVRYEIVGLTNGDPYSVRVAAGFPGYGFADWAATIGVPSRVPAAPRSVDVVPSDEKLTVRWQEPADDGGSPVTEYRVERRADDSPVVEDIVTGSSHEVDGLRNGVEYRVRVAAVNPAGTGAWSETIEAAPVGPPGAPRGLAVERGDRSVDVEWRAPADDGGSDVTAYKVQWRTGRQTFGPSSRQVQVGADHLSHTLTGLANGKEHFVRVLAVNAAGDGDGSGEVSVTPATVAGPPRGVVGVRGDRSVAVEWRAPADDGGSDVTGYRVQWRTEDQQHDSSRQAAVTDLADLSHRVTGLDNGTEHFVRVVAANGVGDGEPSAEVSFTPATAPGAPGSVSAERGDRSITVTWTAADDGGSDVTEHTVQWRVGDADFEDTDPRAAIRGDDLSHRIAGLSSGMEYFVRVKAANGVDDGPWSSSASATPARVAGPPRGVVAVRGDRSVSVSWLEPADDGGSELLDRKPRQRHGVLRAGDGHQRCRRRAVVVAGVGHPGEGGRSAPQRGGNPRRPVAGGDLAAGGRRRRL